MPPRADPKAQAPAEPDISTFAVPLSPSPVYLSRVARCALVAVAMLGGTLLVGTLGYRAIEGFDWLDAFHQSAMLLAGMGPVRDVRTNAGKLFDSFYALACAFVMLGAAGFLFAPMIHRVLHRFHLEDAHRKR